MSPAVPRRKESLAHGVQVDDRWPVHDGVVVTAAGVRITWSDLPDHVRQGVQDLLGSAVVRTTSQTGGFSPGTADRVVTTSGARAFVKAVHPSLDAGTPTLHRREAAISAALPTAVPAPRLLGTYDDDDWIVLVLEEVDGRHPATPWHGDELAAVLSALNSLAAVALPAPLEHLPALKQDMAEDMAGFSRLADDPPADLDPWARAHLEELCALAGRAPAALTGTALVHSDVRADNLQIRPDGSVVLVDWPWAARGAPWLDTLAVLIDVHLHDITAEVAQPHDVEALLAAHTSPATDPRDLDATLVGLTGYFLDAARQPVPPGLPTLRAFQAAEGRATLDWVRRRLDPVS